MYPSPILLPLLLLLLSVAHATVDETCWVAAASHYSINYGFCTTALRGDPGSETASWNELGLTGAQLCLDDAVRIRSKIGDMIAKGKFSQKMKGMLQMCSDEVFSSQIDLLTAAVGLFKSGNFSGAMANIDTVRGRANSCSDIFFEGGEDDVLKQDESHLDELTRLALFLISPLKGR